MFTVYIFLFFSERLRLSTVKCYGGKQKKLNELPSVRTVFHIHAVHFLYTTVSFQVFGKTIEETGLICYTNHIPS